MDMSNGPIHRTKLNRDMMSNSRKASNGRSLQHLGMKSHLKSLKSDH